jgi:dTDP-4-dehydrorhamnose reductase
MVTDHLRTPTFVHDLARGIILIIEKGGKGIYHLSGEQQMTPYEMAIETARFFGLNEGLIEKSLSPDIKQPALRPSRTGFDISKARKELGYKPVTFIEGLKELFL